MPHTATRSLFVTVAAAIVLIGALSGTTHSEGTSRSPRSDPGRARLHVRVLGSDGRPVENGVDADEDDWKLLFSLPLPERWPDEPTLVVVPERASAHLPPSSGSHLRGKRVGAGETVFDVVAGRSYRVGLTGPKQAWRPITVAIREDTSRVDVTLIAASEDAVGTLAITLTAEDGTFVQQDCVVRIEDADEGAPLLRAAVGYADDFNRSFVLPVGRYRVAVEGKPWLDWHGGVVSPSRYGRSEIDVEVGPDRTTPVRVPLVAGARVDLHLLGKALAEDREAFAPRPDRLRVLDVDRAAECARVWLISDGHWPIPVAFTCPATGFGAGRPKVCRELIVGSSNVSELLPVGRFRLEARMPGGRTTSTEVVLVDRETTPITLSFP
jgi:hypothetical protein